MRKIKGLKELEVIYKTGKKKEADDAIYLIILELLYHTLFPYAYRYIKDDEVTRNVLIKIAEEMKKFPPEKRLKIESIEGWIKDMIYKRASSAFRKLEKRNPLYKYDDIDENMTEENTEELYNEFFKTTNANVSKHLSFCKENALNEEEVIIVNFYIDELKRETIATRTGLTPRQVSVKKQSIQRKLMRCVISRIN